MAQTRPASLTRQNAAVCELLLDGGWRKSQATETSEVYNPSTGEVIARVPSGGKEDVDLVVASAKQAFADWHEMPAVERARYMFRFRNLLETHFDEIARSVTREHGKTLNEARASVQRGMEVVEFACGIPSLLTGESLENIASGVDCETVRHALGVCVGITPFNFPAMVPLWMYPVALVCGNTFVLKPSEKVPLTSILIAELLLETGLPAGVFNIVHGGKPCVDALIEHPDVRAISFVGSTAIAKYIYERGTAHGKRVQAAGGAKNHIIIMPDANLDQTVQALTASAFGCAGERCMAGSLAVPVGEAGDLVLPKLVEAAEAIKVGRTDSDENPDMGPVISQAHLDKVKGMIGAGEKEGAQVKVDGRTVKSPHAGGFYLGPTILDKASAKMSVVSEEIFGPVLSVVRVKSIEDAIALGDQSPYGNGAVIYTKSGHAAREFKRRFSAGMIGINVGVPAPMAWFPFTGWNNSFFGDLHMQGREGVMFYTQQKMTMTRWFKGSDLDFKDPIWKSKRQ
jgi:malonate-semialdehyde dehydrogenase (acetylating)/methylmalonate-semialdehyde dehydrogenase